ncbi:hypothetical protein SAMN05444141_101536 [Pseudovibrio denitrificans]|uniref:Uncharacterized protein n=1 Tax=Pseudovibrio denitrificans TaxID=258256 RepID=A0A1I6XZF0_9HYPH|nr:hypothetical protein SAMN05444141_101536 [Pseudovibrio denitrificans]
MKEAGAASFGGETMRDREKPQHLVGLWRRDAVLASDAFYLFTANCSL